MFMPKRIIFEKDALDYPLGQQLYQEFLKKTDVEVFTSATNRVKSNIPGDDLKEQYRHGKQTLVVGVKKSLKFQSCKPSAHYQLPLVSGCMGQCEYCYLNTQLGDKPFVRVHVNLEEILDKAKKYSEERGDDITIFEGSATSDPVPVEVYTHALETCIRYFAKEELMRFRFVTKYTDVDAFCNLPHEGHTEIRFSINTDRVIKEYEHATPNAISRINAAQKVMKAGYPVGFLVAPVFMYEDYQREYEELLEMLRQKLPEKYPHQLTFEVISHRYTMRAKERIQTVFPETTLPMDEETRSYAYGQFGYGKYKYTKEELRQMKEFFERIIPIYFPEAVIKYII